MATHLSLSLHDTEGTTVEIKTHDNEGQTSWIDIEMEGSPDITLFFETLDGLVDWTERLHEEALAVRDAHRADVLNEHDLIVEDAYLRIIDEPDHEAMVEAQRDWDDTVDPHYLPHFFDPTPEQDQP